MEQAVGERHVRQRRPNRIGEICGGFHDDGDGGRAGDVESKLVVLHAKTRVAGLRLRSPRRGRKTAKRCIPTDGPRQIIDCRIVVPVEYIRTTNAGGVTLKIDNI